MKNIFLILILFCCSFLATAQTNTHLFQSDSGGDLNITTSLTGEIRMYGGSSAPAGWALCDGSSLDTTTNNNLFQVLGYTYGGSGANFNVPDMRGRAAIGAGTGVGLVARTLGESIGVDSTTIILANLPSSNINASIDIPFSTSTATLTEGQGNNFGSHTAWTSDPPDVGEEWDISGAVLNLGGSDTPLSMLQPSIVVNYIIAL